MGTWNATVKRLRPLVNSSTRPRPLDLPLAFTCCSRGQDKLQHLPRPPAAPTCCCCCKVAAKFIMTLMSMKWDKVYSISFLKCAHGKLPTSGRGGAAEGQAGRQRQQVFSAAMAPRPCRHCATLTPYCQATFFRKGAPPNWHPSAAPPSLSPSA